MWIALAALTEKHSFFFSCVAVSDEGMNRTLLRFFSNASSHTSTDARRWIFTFFFVCLLRVFVFFGNVTWADFLRSVAILSEVYSARATKCRERRAKETNRRIREYFFPPINTRTLNKNVFNTELNEPVCAMCLRSFPMKGFISLSCDSGQGQFRASNDWETSSGQRMTARKN